MIYTIKNDYLTVDINQKGAELWSIKKRNNDFEYLWQGDPKYWGDRALNLFPHIGLCCGNKYLYKGKEFNLEAHGFVKDLELDVVAKRDNAISFKLIANEYTKKRYAFDFSYILTYTLDGNKIYMDIQVENKGNEEMIFAVGGHPGFNIPLNEGLNYNDYYLEFENKERIDEILRVDCTFDCNILPDITNYETENGKIHLSHEMFKEKVTILKNMPKSVTLKSDKGDSAVKVNYPDMKYLGIWKWLSTDAPYVCIEPWSSIAARYQIVENFETQLDLTKLEAGKTYNNHMEIEIY